MLPGFEKKSEVAQSCLTLCNPVDCSPPGSSVHGILQARILEWVAISFSRGSSWPRVQTWVSHIAADALTSEPQGKPRLWTILQIYGFQNCMVVAQKETQRSAEQTREYNTVKKSMLVFPINLWKRSQEYMMQKRLVSLINCAGKKMDSYMQKSGTDTLAYTIWISSNGLKT